MENFISLRMVGAVLLHCYFFCLARNFRFLAHTQEYRWDVRTSGYKLAHLKEVDVSYNLVSPSLSFLKGVAKLKNLEVEESYVLVCAAEAWWYPKM